MTIVKRLVKGTPLTYSEGDGNLDDLNGRIAVFEGYETQTHKVYTATSAAIQAAINTVVGIGRGVVELMFPTCVLTTGLTLDVSKVSLLGHRTLLDGRGLSNAAILTITGSMSDTTGHHMYEQQISFVEGLILQGDGENDISTATVIGIDAVPGAGTGGSQYTNLRDLHIRHCSVGERTVGHCYLTKHWNVNYYFCGVGYQNVSGSNNSENITWFGGGFGDCVVGIQAASCNLLFVGIKSDYGDGIMLDAGANCIIDIIAGNWEATWQGSAWIVAAGSGTRINVFGGKWMSTQLQDPTLAPYYVSATGGAQVHFWGSQLLGFQNGDDVFGHGRVYCHNTQMFNNGVMPHRVSDDIDCTLVQGDFETSIGAMIFCGGAADYTNRHTGTGVSVALSATTAHTGAQSLAVTKTGSSNPTFGVQIRVFPGQLVTSSFYDRNIAAAVTGTYRITTYWACQAQSEAGIMIASNLVTIGTSSNYTPIDTWTVRGSATIGDRAAPSWATHLRMVFDFTNLGNGTIYIDDLFVSGW